MTTMPRVLSAVKNSRAEKVSPSSRSTVSGMKCRGDNDLRRIFNVGILRPFNCSRSTEFGSILKSMSDGRGLHETKLPPTITSFPPLSLKSSMNCWRQRR